MKTTPNLGLNVPEITDSWDTKKYFEDNFNTIDEKTASKELLDQTLRDIQTVNANAEVLAARGGEALLGDRLAKVDASLAEKATKTELQATASGSPKGVYATLTDLQTAFPTGTTGIYVVTADGKWYFWNGSAWASGGTYQGTAITDYAVGMKKVDTFLYDVITKGKTLDGQTFLVPSTGTSYIGTTNSYIIDKPIQTPTIIKKIKINSNNAVNTRVSVLKKLSETSFKCISVVSFMTSVGEAEYVINLPVPEAGLYLAVSGRVRYLASDATNANAYGLYDVPSNITFVAGDTITVSKSASIIQFGLQAYLDYKSDLSVQIDDLNKRVDTLSASSGLNNPLNGKTLLVIGDSISDENNTTYATTHYYNHLKNIDGLNYIMDGRSGTGYVRPYGGYANIPDRIDAYTGYNPDYIVIFAGTNDWYDGGIPLGVKGDATVSTFYGALKVTYDKLLTKYPLAKVLIATPIRRKLELNGANANGNTLKQYCEAVIDMAHDYSFTVIDLYNEGGLNPTIKASREANFQLLTDGTYDGTHPSNTGQLRLYPKFRAGLLRC